jgi:fumarylacetoacetase
MLELTWEEKLIKLNDGTERKFINDNDTVIMKGSVKMDRYALVSRSFF